MSARLVRRLGRVLAALEERSPRSIAEISRVAGLPYATCHRLVQAMAAERLVCRDERTGRVSRPERPGAEPC